MNARRTQGFTLLELLVVMAVIGILAAIWAQGLLPMIQRGRVDNAVNDLAAMTRYAVSTARRSNHTTTMTINASTRVVEVRRGTTLLQSRQLAVTPHLSCRTACPASFSFSSPFGTNATDFKVNFQLGKTDRTLLVRGPSAAVNTQ